MAALLKRLCDGCLVLYFVNIANDSFLHVVKVNVSEELLDVNDKKNKKQKTIRYFFETRMIDVPKQEFTSNVKNNKKEIWKTLA